MEPKLPSANRGSEQLPSAFPGAIEHSPLMHAPERHFERKNEQRETILEGSSQNTSSPVLPPVQVVASATTNQADDSNGSVSSDDAPLVAADDDLIEKEWVNKAKEIIVKTKDDPYQREREVGKLQADYLRKRYGKELGIS